MCIDGIDYRGPDCIPVYKLPNRNKEFKIFTKCSVILFPEKFEASPFLQAVAAVQKVKIRPGLKRSAAYLRGE
jgi:hypothetical protein